ncbi:MAG TPA: DDE-type integrase/transposase/recombinase [Coleofasciculaceae cyanobacterium]|jgi:transposase InsO family protein
MLAGEDLKRWIDDLELPEVGRKLLEKILSSEPVRRVGGGANNSYGFYSSVKMGKTIAFESGNVEQPGLEQFYEYNSDVLGYLDQSHKFNLRYKSKDGRIVSTGYVPDYFVFYRDFIAIDEWKPEKRLIELVEQYPNRYHQDESRQWRSLPAEEIIQQYGFRFRIRTDTEINWVKVGNIRCLRAYLNPKKEYCVDEQISEAITATVTAHPEGISLSQLRQEVSLATIDDIYTLIAKDTIWVDQDSVSLTDDQERVHIFPNQQIAEACVLMQQCRTSSLTSTLQITNIAEGTTFYWGGKLRTILHVGKDLIYVRGDENMIRLSYADFNSLAQKGDIVYPKKQAAEAFPDEVQNILLRASPTDLAEANRRYWIIAPRLHGQATNESTPERTVRAWLAKYREAEEKYGFGLAGLISKKNSGNHYSRYSQEVWDFADEIISTEYETGTQPTRLAAYGILLAQWSKQKEEGKIAGDPPSYQAFCERINNRPIYQRTLARQGKRAAYQVSSTYLELEYKTPRHGSRPFEICHIDHTEEDIEVICPRTSRNLGRPWTSVLIDAYSRRILAVWMSFDPPSYRSCMMVLRICVQRFNRFPETIVVDNGKEFQSVYFDTLLAAFGCHKKHRPAGKPRFGSIIERFFETSHTQFFYNLRANTQITKFVRWITKSNDPKRQATWTLGELYEHYVFGYCYGFYDEDKTHPALGQTPCEAFDQALLNTGSRPHQFIAYSQAFIILTLPSTRKGTARVQIGRGVKINTFWYAAKDGSFNHQDVENKDVPVRYDPFNLGEAFAFARGLWVPCISEHYSILRGRTEKELQVYTVEKRQERRKYGQALSALAKGNAIRFLSTDRPTEKQALQRQRDLSTLDVQQRIEEGYLASFSVESNGITTLAADSCNEGASVLESVNEPANKIDLTVITSYRDDELWEL